MKIKTVAMDVNEFLNIQSNPIQRDTKIHAQKALKFHLSSASITQEKVAIARNGKSQWKLDGHTRAYLWEKGLLEAPNTVSCDIYPVENVGEAIQLYKEFDNTDAAETIADKTTGALNYMGITNYNKFFSRNTGLVSAIQNINLALKKYEPRQDIVQMLLPWKKELQMLINQHWTSNTSQGLPGVPSCIISCFLVTTRMYKNDSLGFWDGYYYGIGSETLKSGRCGCTAAIDWIFKARKDELIGGRVNSMRNIEAVLTAYFFYRAKKPVKKLNELYKRNHNTSYSMQLGQYLEDIGFKL